MIPVLADVNFCDLRVLSGSKGHSGSRFETNFEGDDKDISLAVLNIGI
jgi:hypothetical protein